MAYSITPLLTGVRNLDQGIMTYQNGSRSCRLSGRASGCGGRLGIDPEGEGAWRDDDPELKKIGG